MPPSVEERAADGEIADDNTVMNGLPRARTKVLRYTLYYMSCSMKNTVLQQYIVWSGSGLCIVITHGAWVV